MDSRFEGSVEDFKKFLDRKECYVCGGTGVLYGSVYIKGGGNIPDGGSYEFESRTCECQIVIPDREE